ncbi:MAG TPA: hypothetical protein VF607_05510, partial [Verrucomicrobiae bacterium]
YTSGANVAFERVFSWLDASLKGGTFAGSVATNLSAWNATNLALNIPGDQTAPRVVNQVANVGDRINPPAGEPGSGVGEAYLAGYINQAAGNSFSISAYADPFAAGFEAANAGAIIPVNAIPGTNTLEVHWFRPSSPRVADGFQPVYWPAVIGRYTVQWPQNPDEIVLASNAGSGPLPSLKASGHIYYQNDRTAAGYNPNEEHALMQGGQAWALRDDLNVTSGPGYSSAPFVLLEYTEADGRPAMDAFRVLREKPSAGITFNFQATAGQVLQPPMPLPLLPLPLGAKVAGAPAPNLDHEVAFATVASGSSQTINLTYEIWDSFGRFSRYETNQLSLPVFLTSERHPFGAGRRLALTDVSGGAAASLWVYPVVADAGNRRLAAVVSRGAAMPISATAGNAIYPNYQRYLLPGNAQVNVTDKVVVYNAAAGSSWIVSVISRGNAGTNVYVDVRFPGGPIPPAALGAAELALISGDYSATGAAGWRLSFDAYSSTLADAGQRDFYNRFTFQDRKGSIWVYRGPNRAADS